MYRAPGWCRSQPLAWNELLQFGARSRCGGLGYKVLGREISYGSQPANDPSCQGVFLVIS